VKKRLKITEEIDAVSPEHIFGGGIEEAIIKLQRLYKLYSEDGWEDIQVSSHQRWGLLLTVLRGTREEYDWEYETRLEEEKYKKTADGKKEEEEYKKYLKLKEKFESKAKENGKI